MSELEKRLMKHIDLLVERYPSLESEKNSIISAYLLLEECYVMCVLRLKKLAFRNNESKFFKIF